MFGQSAALPSPRPFALNFNDCSRGQSGSDHEEHDQNQTDEQRPGQYEEQTFPALLLHGCTEAFQSPVF